MAQEQIDKKAEAKKATAKRKAERNAALNTIKELVGKPGNEKYAEALKFAHPHIYGLAASGEGKAARKPKSVVIAEMIAAKRTMTEDELFKQTRIDRKEAATIIRTALKNAKPEERLWIAFDDEKGVYSLAGKGANPPKDWEGFVPIAKTEVAK